MISVNFYNHAMFSVYSKHQTRLRSSVYTDVQWPRRFTLWGPLLPYGYSYKASRARPGKAVICNFWHPGTLTLRTERQSALMSKISNDGLTRSGTGSFIAVSIWQQWALKG